MHVYYANSTIKQTVVGEEKLHCNCTLILSERLLEALHSKLAIFELTSILLYDAVDSLVTHRPAVSIGISMIFSFSFSVVVFLFFGGLTNFNKHLFDN